MTTTSATWLPHAIARAAVVTPLPQAVPASRVGGRHSAPEFAEVMEVVASEFDVDRRGRHADADWARELFDPRCDDDPFDWLGFTADQD
jgi:hypothetical protein